MTAPRHLSGRFALWCVLVAISAPSPGQAPPIDRAVEAIDARAEQLARLRQAGLSPSAAIECDYDRVATAGRELSEAAEEAAAEPSRSKTGRVQDAYDDIPACVSGADNAGRGVTLDDYRQATRELLRSLMALPRGR